MEVWKSIRCEVNPIGIDWAYKSLTTCYHPDSYGDLVDQEVKLKKIAEVLRRGHLSIARYVDLFWYLEGVPHSVAMQLRTHKFLDCQITSQRYTGEHLLTGDLEKLAESYFYSRPPGTYLDRNGRSEITSTFYKLSKKMQANSILCYRELVLAGYPKESARDVLAQGIRQSMTIHTNLQGFMDMLRVRTLKDSQWEVREVVFEMLDQVPEIYLPILNPFMDKLGKNQQTF